MVVFQDIDSDVIDQYRYVQILQLIHLFTEEGCQGGPCVVDHQNPHFYPGVPAQQLLLSCLEFALGTSWKDDVELIGSQLESNGFSYSVWGASNQGPTSLPITLF